VPAVGLHLAPEQGTLAWVQYMRFAKRTGGIMAARKVGLRLCMTCWGLWCLNWHRHAGYASVAKMRRQCVKVCLCVKGGQ
jgi:hypothetical protein